MSDSTEPQDNLNSTPSNSASSPKADKFEALLSAAPSKPKLTVTPRTRIFLYLVLGLFSLLLANGLYLSAITFMENWFRRSFQDQFYHYMFLGHLGLGLLFTIPFLLFGFYHWSASRKRRNYRAIRIGYGLLTSGFFVLISGFLLVKLGNFEFMQNESGRRVAYWIHVVAPFVAMWLYWLHRLVGTRIRWYIARRVGLVTMIAVCLMVIAQTQDPRKWNRVAPSDGKRYFENSLASTRDGNFISSKALMNDEYCQKCHPNVYDDWFHSAHHFSSFNNPAYLYAVRETRQVSMERDGNVHASRFCAGCHDPVPLFTGAFDRPDYDDVNDPTSQAGITCSVCHAITEVESTRGNGDYVIEEPLHYPFAYSSNPILQQINALLVKAKPAFHKSEMLKPVHKTEEFCSTCHKVHLPGKLTKYKDWLRGQNHYDTFLLSGVAGHGARSFYYPKTADENCNRCHMPTKESTDFGSFVHSESGKRVVHDHNFPGGNTALPFWRADDYALKEAQKILIGCARVDLFGVREEGKIDGSLTAPLRPNVPTLVAGKKYLLETVIRTLKLGHHLTQGTVDSNELWLEVRVTSGGKTIGVSGGMTENKAVDEYSHFVNNFVIDRKGNRIARRNAQDIFIALYDHQIPPGAGQVAHYSLQVPESIEQPIEVTVKLNYRKFDKGYVEFMDKSFKAGDRDFLTRESSKNELPITVIAEDRVVFSIAKQDGTIVQTDGDQGAKPVEEVWQRWNDYGIGTLLTGNGQLRLAENAFKEVEKLGRYDGPLNLARVYSAEGDTASATDALIRAASMDPPPPSWTFSWLNGEVARQQNQFETAVKNLRAVLYDNNEERRSRKFDFSRDYVVRNLLASTYFDMAMEAKLREDEELYKSYLIQSRDEFLLVLKEDSENVTAHANLSQIYERLGESEKGKFHLAENLKYKPDDNAGDVGRREARRLYPAANKAAEQIVIYSLQRPGAPELPTDSAIDGKADETATSPPGLDQLDKKVTLKD